MSHYGVPDDRLTNYDEDVNRQGDDVIINEPPIANDDDTFTVVKTRKTKRKSKKNLVPNFHHDLSDCNSVEREITESKAEVLRKINNCATHLSTSEYYSKFEKKITEELPQVSGVSTENLNILCLGLGPISSHLLSRISRYQLALLILLKNKFHASVEIYDPVFTAQEKSILTLELGFDVSEINEEGKRVVENPTLLFMPHCPHQLVNNLLYTNWDPLRLKNCYILCNSLSETVSSIPCKYLDKNLYYLRQAHSICTEIAVPNTFTDHPDVFNDIALHLFPSTNLINLNEEFWVEKPHPVYAKQDFISKES